jgi:monoamine oxidase
MGKRKDPNEDQPEEGKDRTNESEDNFGLPDIEYQPLAEGSEQNTGGAGEDQPHTSASSEESTTSSYQSGGSEYRYIPPEEKSNAPVIIGIVIAVVIVVAGYLIYNYVYKPASEKAKQEELARQKVERDRAEKERLAREAQAAAAALEKQRADSVAAANAKPPAGTIETLNGQTRRYYVVISSAIDDDLVLDYARKLSAKGVSTQIIPPFGKTKFYRLALGDFDTYAIAQNNADQAKGEYGSEVWVVRY